MSRPINFGNVNISLAQFQEVSSGKHNAGEIRLTGENSIAKVNNHVTLRGKNNVALSHEEVLAVKQAFVKALSEGGVASGEIANIRKELGLAAEKAVDTSLKDRAIKPLSRQQVREILDRNAVTINAHAGEGTIRASDELYANVSDGERRARAEKRDAANAGLAARRDVTVNQDLARFESIVSGDLVYDTHDERRELLKAANTALETVMRRCGGRPRANVQAELTLTTSDGAKSFTFAPGMNEAEFVAALENMIVRLSLDRLIPAGFALDDDKPETWRAWAPKACATDEAKTNPKLVDALIAAALRATEGRPEARKAVFADLDGLFVADGGRLRKPWEVAKSIRESHPNPAQRVDWASLSDKEFNNRILNCLGGTFGALPDEYKEMAFAVREEMRVKFGEAGLPDRMSDLAWAPEIAEKLNAKNAPRATPENMIGWYRELAAKRAAHTFILNALTPRLKENRQVAISPLSFTNDLRKKRPDLFDRVAGATSPAAARAILAEYGGDITDGIRRLKDCNEVRAALPAKTFARLREKLGIPVANLEAKFPGGPQRLQALGKKLYEDILSGKNGSDTRKQIEAAFDRLADRYVKEVSGVFAKIDALQVSDAAKSRMKAHALAQDKADNLDFNAIAEAAKSIPVDILRARLAENAPKEAVYEAMKGIHEKNVALANSLFAAVGKRGIGQDDLMNMTVMLLECAIDATPGLRDAVNAFMRREDVRNDTLHDPATLAFNASDFLYVFPEANDAKRVASQLGTPQLPPLHAGALLGAVRASGPEGLPDDEALALFAEGKPAGAALRTKLATYHEVSPATLETLAREALGGV